MTLTYVSEFGMRHITSCWKFNQSPFIDMEGMEPVHNIGSHGQINVISEIF